MKNKLKSTVATWKILVTKERFLREASMCKISKPYPLGLKSYGSDLSLFLEGWHRHRIPVTKKKIMLFEIMETKIHCQKRIEFLENWILHNFVWFIMSWCQWVVHVKFRNAFHYAKILISTLELSLCIFWIGIITCNYHWDVYYWKNRT